MERNKTVNLFVVLCGYGYLSKAQRIADEFSITRDEARSCSRYALRWSCARGHLDVAQWLVDRFEFTLEDVISPDTGALRSACLHGQQHVVEWLVDRFEITPDEVRRFDQCERNVSA